MAIAKYVPTCAKNVPGNAPELYLIEASLITSVTESADEISAVTMAGDAGVNKFKRIKADFDSVQFTSEGTFKTSGAETQNLIFRLSKPTKALEILLNSLKDATACGMVAIYVDGNRLPKAYGISAVAKEGKTRPINQMGTSFDSGVLPTDEDTQAYTITLTRMGAYGPVPFDTANTTTILNGSAAFIDWTA